MFLTFFSHKGSLINHKARNLCKLHRKQFKMTPPSGLFLFADDHNHHHRRHYYYNYQNYYYYYYHYYHYHNYVLTNKTRTIFSFKKSLVTCGERFTQNGHHFTIGNYLPFNPFSNKPWFLRVCSTSLLKTLLEKEKLLVTRTFFFFSSHSKLSSAYSFSLEESKICRLGKG